MNQIQVYTGDGKGKTTAALGLILRYLGWGGRACLVQFDKGGGEGPGFYHERRLFPSLPGLTHVPTGLPRFDEAKKRFRFANLPGDFEEARRGLSEAETAMRQGHGLVVLDEVLSLVLTRLVSEREIEALLDRYEALGRPCELVLTGHRVWPSLLDRVDLVTEMRKVKHYFEKKVEARPGLEY